jgi:hypothetical protein
MLLSIDLESARVLIDVARMKTNDKLDNQATKGSP